MVLDSGFREGLETSGEVVAVPADNYAFTKPFAEYSVGEIMLTLIFIILLIRLVLDLFMKKWGFFDW